MFLKGSWRLRGKTSICCDGSFPLKILFANMDQLSLLFKFNLVSLHHVTVQRKSISQKSNVQKVQKNTKQYKYVYMKTLQGLLLMHQNKDDISWHFLNLTKT